MSLATIDKLIAVRAIRKRLDKAAKAVKEIESALEREVTDYMGEEQLPSLGLNAERIMASIADQLIALAEYVELPTPGRVLTISPRKRITASLKASPKASPSISKDDLMSALLTEPLTEHLVRPAYNDASLNAVIKEILEIQGKLPASLESHIKIYTHYSVGIEGLGI